MERRGVRPPVGADGGDGRGCSSARRCAATRRCSTPAAGGRVTVALASASRGAGQRGRRLARMVERPASASVAGADCGGRPARAGAREPVDGCSRQRRSTGSPTTTAVRAAARRAGPGGRLVAQCGGAGTSPPCRGGGRGRSRGLRRHSGWPCPGTSPPRRRPRRGCARPASRDARRGCTSGRSTRTSPGVPDDDTSAITSAPPEDRERVRAAVLERLGARRSSSTTCG